MRISNVLPQGRARMRRPRCAVLLACLGAALALGVVARSASTPAPSFAAPREYPTGDDPQQVAIGDLDGDGKRDLATANFENGTVSVLINRGDGSFEPRRDYAAGEATALSVAIGDLDGDGRQDLVVVGDTVTVRLNRGADRFPSREYESGDNPFSVAIGDVNGDGKPDLATANLNANSASVLINKERAIGRAGCRAGRIRRAYSNAVGRGHVISERPSFGVVLRQGARVDLVVSLGRKS
jgi:hypothetical protein